MKLIHILFSLILMAPVILDAQCRPWTKNKCFPMLDDLIQSNSNVVKMAEGENVDLILTFYGGKEYRLVICAHPILENVSYEVTDIFGELIYKSDSYTSPTYDFKMENTQQLIVKVHVPEKEDSVISHEGCLSVLTGFKKTI